MAKKKRSSIWIWALAILILGIAISPVFVAAAIVLGIFKALAHTE